MTKTIYKYTLRVSDEQTLPLPSGSKILSVLNQHETIVLYALVNTETEEVDSHTIHIRGTGHPCDEVKGEFLGSVSMYEGNLIFHVWVE